MNEDNFQFMLNLLGKATDQLDRVIGIVEKQEQRITELADRVAKLEYQKEEK